MTNEATLLLVHGRGVALSVKRTYRIVPNGRAVPADEQPPLATGIDVDDRLLVADSEAMAFKPGTDVVFPSAAAHAPAGRAVTELPAGVRVNGRERALRVFGRRRVVRRNGAWAFSDPEPFTSAPITWREAYGGTDELSRAEVDPPLLGALQKYVSFDLSSVTRAAYPRNPVGKGYVLTERPEVEGMELPTIEDPNDLLTPARLFAGHPDSWYRQPLPAGLGFINYFWFPRSAYCGLEKVVLPPGVDPGSVRIPEIERGWAPANVLSSRPIEGRVGERASNGASRPLVFEPHLSGDEEISLLNLDPRDEVLRFRLPGARPNVAIRLLGEDEREVPAKLMTVSVDVAKRRVALIWSATVVPKLPHLPEHAPRVEYRVRW